jgi:hypothetical protein
VGRNLGLSPGRPGGCAVPTARRARGDSGCQGRTCPFWCRGGVRCGAGCGSPTHPDDGTRKPKNTPTYMNAGPGTPLDDETRKSKSRATGCRRTVATRCDDGSRKPKNRPTYMNAGLGTRLDEETRKPKSRATGCRRTVATRCDNGSRKSKNTPTYMNAGPGTPLDDETRKPKNRPTSAWAHLLKRRGEKPHRDEKHPSNGAGVNLPPPAHVNRLVQKKHKLFCGKTLRTAGLRRTAVGRPRGGRVSRRAAKMGRPSSGGTTTTAEGRARLAMGGEAARCWKVRC